MSSTVFPLTENDHTHWTWACPPRAEGGCGYQTFWTFTTEEGALQDYDIHAEHHTPPPTHPTTQEGSV